MNEFVRFIEKRDFDEGIDQRLLIGSIVVGDICKIRFEEIDRRIKERPTRCAEATISIVRKSEKNGLWRVDYVYEALRTEGTRRAEVDFFDQESIATTYDEGRALRTYLSDQTDTRWDDAIERLIELESIEDLVL